MIGSNLESCVSDVPVFLRETSAGVWKLPRYQPQKLAESTPRHQQHHFFIIFTDQFLIDAEEWCMQQVEEISEMPPCGFPSTKKSLL
jgi:hypothetical protein